MIKWLALVSELLCAQAGNKKSLTIIAYSAFTGFVIIFAGLILASSLFIKLGAIIAAVAVLFYMVCLICALVTPNLDGYFYHHHIRHN